MYDEKENETSGRFHSVTWGQGGKAFLAFLTVLQIFLNVPHLLSAVPLKISHH